MCTTWVATPANRRKEAASSKLPSSGTIPRRCNTGTRAGLLVSAYTRADDSNPDAARKPTSPQPTINTRGRRKRAGNAPKGIWFEGKIQSFVVHTKPEDNKHGVSSLGATQWPFFHR
jgi:hypothetical protein